MTHLTMNYCDLFVPMYVQYMEGAGYEPIEPTSTTKGHVAEAYSATTFWCCNLGAADGKKYIYSLGRVKSLCALRLEVTR